jgi:threonine 3-dehydrogenase
MKALMKEYPKPGLSLVDIEKPQIKNPDDVLFEVKYCAICVGETKVYDWTEWAASDKTIQLPTVLGHEASGVVVEVGGEVKQFKPGDRITNDVSIHCGHCRQCRSGATNVCENLEIYGKRRGAFAQYAILPQRVICRLNDRLSLEEGALMENFGVAVHAVELEHHDVGDWAVIVGGAGPIGIMAAQTLLAYGVNTIITDILDWRLDFARRFCNAVVVDARKEDPVQKVMEHTAGKGADFVIEMGANQTVMDQAFDMVRIRGTVVTIGTFNKPISFNPFFKMSRREIRLQSMMGHNWETWRRMNQLIDSGKINLKPLITHILPMEEYRKAFELAKSYEAMKVLLKP